MEREEEFIRNTADKVIAELTQEDKDYLLEHPDPTEHHFGLGLNIRNQFIYGKDLGFPGVLPDALSAEIVEKVIAKLKQGN